jgi:Ran GTPase-activating protein (RanGAP) involved in mRNA processing and transport
MEVAESDWFRKMRFVFPGPRTPGDLDGRIQFVCSDIIIEVDLEGNTDVSDATLPKLLNKLTKQRKCAKCNLSATSIGPRTGHELGNLIARGNGLQTLRLSSLTVDRREWAPLLAGLFHGLADNECGLEELDLSNNPGIADDDEKREVLNQLLSRLGRGSLRVLELKNCGLTSALSSSVFVNLQYVNLSGSRFENRTLDVGPSALQTFVAANAGTVTVRGLHACKNLRIINLNGTTIDTATIDSIAELLSNPNDVAELLLANTTADVSAVVNSSRAESWRLQEVDFTCCSLRSVPADAWSSFGSSLAKARSIKLRSCGLPIAGVNSLANVNLPHLQMLDVSENALTGLSSDDYKGLFSHQALHNVLFENCGLDDRTTNGIAVVLRSRSIEGDLQGRAKTDAPAPNCFTEIDAAELKPRKLVVSTTGRIVQPVGSQQVRNPIPAEQTYHETLTAEEYRWLMDFRDKKARGMAAVSAQGWGFMPQPPR